MTDKENESQEQPKAPSDRIIQKVIEDEMRSSYIDYAMSVIIGRALPDVRDGLKPVHRRILYAMNDMGMFHNKPFKKSARIVGEVLGKYHPHGDTAVYDTMVRMAQPFSLRYPLINGQGNFGSVDGDNAASMRYTEARLKKIAEEMLTDIEKDTVNFRPNFDESLKEPEVLPAKLPNLMINGSSGIAVGMATNIPPHNIGEIIKGAIAAIDNPEITIEELMDHIKGPDFPTGGIITGMNGITQAYLTGRGKVSVKARSEIEDHKGRQRIIVTEIPYMVNKAQVIEHIAGLVREKRIQGISDIRDESDREGMRIVFEIKKDSNPNLVQNQLFAYSRLATTFGMNMLVLVDNEPKTLDLKQIIQHYIKHRQLVVRRRTQFDLNKAEQKAHILEGLTIALRHIEDIVQKVKKSKDTATAHAMLMSDYNLSDAQAKAILDMKLQKLSNLEQDKIREEYKHLLELIDKLKKILASEQEILKIIKEELNKLERDYGDERRTSIEAAEEEELVVEDLIKEEDVVVTISHKGYMKRLPITTYRQQGRGGSGLRAAGTREEDFIEDVFVASTHTSLLLFSNRGRVHWLKVYKLPEASRQAAGKAIVNLVNLEPGEKINAFIPVREFDDDHYLALVTKKGIVKKTSLDAYSRPRQGGIIAITLDKGDELVNAMLTDGTKELMLVSRKGMAARFHEHDVRPIGRTGKGVRGITLKHDDYVVGAVIAEQDKTILTITENGYGKRTLIDQYRLIRRGGVGVINIQCSGRNGKVVSVKAVDEEDDIIIITQKGIIIRTSVRNISIIGRNTQGVRLMRLKPDDKVVAAARIVSEE